MSKHKGEKHEAANGATPAEIQAAVARVAELAADAAAKREVFKVANAESAKADEACAAADCKLREAEDALLKAARVYKSHEPHE